MANTFQPARYAFGYPDQAGYPDGTGTLSQDQKLMIDDVMDGTNVPNLRFAIVKDEQTQAYHAIADSGLIGELTYLDASDHRVTLVHAMVNPELRNQGIASRIIQYALDDVRELGKTITIICPVVRAFIDQHPEYETVVDRVRPGVAHAPAPSN